MAETKNIWDDINEIEIDDSWRKRHSQEYIQYRGKFKKAQSQQYLGDFPLSLEIEATYHCNLECPYCPRAANIGEREEKHMPQKTWDMIVKEIKANKLSSILMDHEAESLVNKNFFHMLSDVKAAGVFDIWLHSNANILTTKISEQLIDGGITKINFSIDAATKKTYEKLRVGGKFERVLKNIDNFLRLKKEKQANHIRTRVSFVVMPENKNEMQDFFEYWKVKEGINLITFQNCEDFSFFEKPDGDELLSQSDLHEKYGKEEPFYCSMPWEMPVIDVEGNIAPCGVPIREHSKKFVLGNLNNGDTIKSCWQGAAMKNLREIHKSGKWYLNNMCRVCVKQRRLNQTDSTIMTS